MKQLSRYSQPLLLGLLGVLLLAGLYVLAETAGWRWDATSNKRYSLNEQTAQVLGTIDTQVKAVAFFLPQEPGRTAAKDLFELFQRAAPDFQFEFVDPDRDPFRAREMGISQTGEVVVLSGDRKEKVLNPDEESLANAVIRVTESTSPTVYMVQGHGELHPQPMEESGAGTLLKELEKQGLSVDTLTLAREKAIPADANLIMILGPRNNFLSHELDILGGYLASGGRVLVALDAQDTTNLDDWLVSEAGVRRLDGLVLDPVSQLITGNYVSPVMQEYNFKPITKGFRLLTIYPTATALEPVPGSLDDGHVLQAIGTSTQDSWLETDLSMLGQGKAKFNPKKDTPGPLWLAAALERPAKGADNATTAASSRLAVYGDQDFLSDTYINLAGNLDLIKNTVNWLMARDNLITVSKPKRNQALLFPEPGQNLLLMWTPVAIVPGAVLVLAVFIARRRRRNR